MSPEAGRGIESWLQRLTLARALPVLALVLALIAWNRGIALLYGLVALLLATLAVAWLAPRLNLTGVRATRRAPAVAEEGEVRTLEVEIQVSGRLARYMLEVEDCLPWAEPDDPIPTAYFDKVRGQARLALPVRCDLRGEHLLGPLRLSSAYPLGLHRREVVLPDSETRLLVYPTPLPLRHLPLPHAARNPDPGADNASRAGGGDLFLGVREYRHGDNPRHVHWSATARHDRLMVKEFDYPRGTRLMIVLDARAGAQAGQGRHSTLEYAVKIAVSVAHHALTGHHQVGLLALAEPPLHVPLGRGAPHFHAIQEALARLQATGRAPYAEAVRQARAELGDGGNLLLFEHGAPVDPAPAQALRIRFDMAGFGGPVPASRPRREAYVHVVRQGDDLARVFES